MRLKSLEIHGFKSFADKTKLEFHEGVTGIVGPNGCGKSNIVDSMRWVLGETSAKALRGGEMADVIFNGTDKRSPLGMAEVTLTLSGCSGILATDYDEVSLGRRVFRDGKSEYLINKQPVRLKDIHNLLMDTGIGRTSYSIMEQGKIDMLLSSKPEDRRAVFEEAAGITKYKTQKKEALRKLDYTEANLVRIRDVIAENERQIRSLSRQASKAKRYQSLFDDVRTLELHLGHKKWREIRAEKSELSSSIRHFTLRQEELEESIEKRQAEMASARVEYQEIERRLAELQNLLSRLENEVSNAGNRIEFNVERTHEHSVRIRQNEEEIAEATEKRVRQEADLDNANRQLEAVAARIFEEQAGVETLELETRAARQRREELNLRIRGIEEERSTLKSRIASLEAHLATNERQTESDEQRSTQLAEEILRLRADEESRKGDAAEFKDRIAGHQLAIEGYEENLAELEQKYHRARRSAADLQEDLSSLHKLRAEKRSRLEVLDQLIADGEGFEKGVQEVLKGLNDPEFFTPHLRAPLANHIEVDGRFADAIEAALGRRLQSVIVSDIAIAEKVIATLREGNLGKASVIAESHLSAAETVSRGRAPLGSIGWASEQVRCDPKVDSLVSRLLEGILLVEDLPTALRLREESGAFAIATLAGEFITTEGIIHGGRTGDDSISVLRMQTEVRELAEVTAALDYEVESRQGRRDELNKRVDEFEAGLQEARERLQQKRVSSSTLEGKLALIERDLNQLRNRIESLEWERREVDDRALHLRAALEEKRSERDAAAIRVSELDAETSTTASDLEEARFREEQLTEEVTGARTRLAVENGTREKFEEQRDPMLARLAELVDLVTRRETEIVDYLERTANAASETQVLQKRILEWEAEASAATAERTRILEDRKGYSAKIEEGETELTRKRKEVQQVASQMGKEQVKVAQLDLTLENLERHCRDRYRTELEFFEPDSHALLLAIEERRKNGATRLRAYSESDSDDEESHAASSGIPTAESIGEAMEDHAAEDPDDEIPVLEDPAEPDWEFVEDVVSQLRTKLDSMGPVNIDAIEEFDELEEHYKFNVQQLEDLENSKEELLRMIARINRDTRKMFSETFELIRKNFRDMFRELFGDKAKADLVLLDDNDPLECGIDIIAKPPGKKLQSISLLSGGERSMTAVALLFGIYMVKPSPFCVLDELDAPLDESNIARFLRVLDRFIGGSQFVIVTHSKRTMSRADVMYGVSMEEFGVSKTVGVTFSKAGESKGGKQAMVGG
ncbi:MAG: chromosome segregation protein SMC [Verrucomicrobiia bacterium Tous-C2TDCM]|nr:MAG: chromosome segregation protein SMC [Verrucomicrobiae bacterium Tous-C2TDCM]